MRSSQRTAGRTIGLLAMVFLPLLGCQRTPRDPDVILLVVDTLRAKNLSLYGYDRATSPALEKFAKDAVTYENAVSPGTWSVPAHASLLTGRWPSFHGAERVPGDRLLALPINPEVTTLATTLAAGGWRTGGFVANTTYLSALFGFDRGFQRYASDYGFVRADQITRDVGDWLASEPGKAFVFVNILDPHEPYEPPPPFDTMFPGRNPDFGASMNELVNVRHERLTPEAIAHFVSQYDGEIAFTDQALGTFFDRLRKVGRYDSSLIFITSDHGELLGEHGLAGHGIAPLEPLIRVPLLVKYPGNRGGGTREERRVTTMAIFATVLQTLGIPTPPGTQAVPLDQPHPVFVEDIDPVGQRVRIAYDGDHKLVSVTRLDGATQVSLYDLASDPDESKPRSMGDDVRALADELTRFTALERPVNIAQRPVIDAEKEAKLRALGYVR